jgi:hypothetical protein
MSQTSEQFFSASSSTASESPLSDGSVCSEELDQLLESLKLGRASAGGRRLVLSGSESEAEPSPACSPPEGSREGAGCPEASREPARAASLRPGSCSRLALAGLREAGGGEAVQQATPGQPRVPQAAATQQGGDIEVIDLLSSSPSSDGGGSDEEAWATVRPTTQRKRCVARMDVVAGEGVVFNRQVAELCKRKVPFGVLQVHGFVPFCTKPGTGSYACQGLSISTIHI